LRSIRIQSALVEGVAGEDGVLDSTDARYRCPMLPGIAWIKEDALDP
jgi:hypothetical protein